MKKILILLSLMFLLHNCATVRPYQKVYLNQEDMNLADSKMQFFETNFETYREGAAGANGGKVGGGCGCN